MRWSFFIGKRPGTPILKRLDYQQTDPPASAKLGADDVDDLRFSGGVLCGNDMAGNSICIRILIISQQ